MRGHHLFLFAALALPACQVAPGKGDDPHSSAQFRHWLVPYLHGQYPDLPLERRADVNFGYALVDLNGDGSSEAIVYLSGSMCGTGGCGLRVLVQTGRSWREVASTSIGYAPIRVLTEKTHGWRDLSIYSRFNATRGHHARLRFNGTSYPHNPSVLPAEPIASTSDEAAIVDANTPLFPR